MRATALVVLLAAGALLPAVQAADSDVALAAVYEVQHDGGVDEVRVSRGADSLVPGRDGGLVSATWLRLESRPQSDWAEYQFREIETGGRSSLQVSSTESGLYQHEWDFDAGQAPSCFEAVLGTEPVGDCWLSQRLDLFVAPDGAALEWLSDEPFPSRIVAQRTEWILLRTEPGQLPTPIASAPQSGSVVPTAAAAWGPLDDGVDFPHTLSGAFYRVTQDSVWSTKFDEWRRSEPSFGAAAAESRVEVVAGVARLRWNLVLQGERSHAVVDSAVTLVSKRNPTNGDVISRTALLTGDSGFVVRDGRSSAANVPDGWPRIGDVHQKLLPLLVPKDPPALTGWGISSSADDRGAWVRLDFDAQLWPLFDDTEWSGDVRTLHVWVDENGRLESANFTSRSRVELALASGHSAPAASAPAPEPMTTVPLVVGFSFAAAAAWLIRRIAAFAGFGFRREGAEEPQTRQRILELIRDEPGIHLGELCRRVDFSKGTVEYHVRRLVRARTIRESVMGSYRCFYLPGSKPIDSEKLLASKARGAQRILEAVRRYPGTSAAELAEAAGLSRSTVAYHLRRLIGASLARKDAAGRLWAAKAAQEFRGEDAPAGI